MSLVYPVSVIKPKALADSPNNVPKIGITIGKVSIAIKVELLSALEAMAETKVKVMEKPTLPKNKINQNNPTFLTGFS